MSPFQSNQKPIGGYNVNRIDTKKGRVRRLLVLEEKQIRPGLQLLRFDRLQYRLFSLVGKLLVIIFPDRLQCFSCFAYLCRDDLDVCLVFPVPLVNKGC